GAGTEARLEAGPVVELWKVDGDRRSRVGGRAAAAVEWPIARALTGSLRVSGVLTGSVFDPAEVPAGVERLATRRVAIAIGRRFGNRMRGCRTPSSSSPASRAPGPCETSSRT